jgi:Protein of unknown function (DUF1579)
VQPEILHDESAIAMTIDPLLGGIDMLQSYEASIGRDAVEGRALIGPAQSGVVVAWVDSWHTSGLVLVSHGGVEESGLTVATTFMAEGEDWRWTTRIALHRDELLIRHFNEGPGVPRYLGVEARLQKV